MGVSLGLSLGGPTYYAKNKAPNKMKVKAKFIYFSSFHQLYGYIIKLVVQDAS